jgi:hypothetical protein
MLLVPVLLLASTVNATTYSDTFKEQYLSQTDKTTIEGPLEAKVVLANSAGWRVEVLRTDGTKMPYESQTALVQIFDRKGERRGGLIVRGFRTIEAEWASEQWVFINVGIGRIASVIALHDAYDNKLIFQSSVHYDDGN